MFGTIFSDGETMQLMEKVKTRTAEMWKDEHDIFWVRILPVVEIDWEDITDNMLVTRTITQNKPSLKLLDARTKWKITSAAQEYYKKEDVPERTIARAVLVASVADKLIQSFLTRLYRQEVPLRFFTSEEEAIKWLLSQKK
jgi:hypothetical protein